MLVGTFFYIELKKYRMDCGDICVQESRIGTNASLNISINCSSVRYEKKSSTHSHSAIALQ